MEKPCCRLDGGYTFIEILVAVTILGIVIVPFLGFFTVSFAAINKSGQQSIAINLCRAKMESTRALGYEAVYSYYISNANSPRVEEDIPLHPGIRRVTEIRPVSIDTGGHLAQQPEVLHIKITVFWETTGTEDSATLESYLGPR